MSPNPQQTGRVVAHTPFPNRQVSGLFHSIKAGLYRSESSLSAYCPTCVPIAFPSPSQPASPLPAKHSYRQQPLGSRISRNRINLSAPYKSLQRTGSIRNKHATIAAWIAISNCCRGISSFSFSHIRRPKATLLSI